MEESASQIHEASIALLHDPGVKIEHEAIRELLHQFEDTAMGSHASISDTSSVTRKRPESQAIVDWLLCPDHYPERPSAVELIETHIS